MAKINIREFDSGDAEAVAAIYNESIDKGDATFDEVHQTGQDILKMLWRFNNREAILVLEKGTRIIGFAIIKRYSNRPGYRVTCETATYLLRKETGSGYGTELKKAVMEKCRELEYHHLVAKIFADNERSIEYNKKLGYEIVGRQKEVGTKNGKWVDIVIMQCLLS